MPKKGRNRKNLKRTRIQGKISLKARELCKKMLAQNATLHNNGFFLTWIQELGKDLVHVESWLTQMMRSHQQAIDFIKDGTMGCDCGCGFESCKWCSRAKIILTEFAELQKQLEERLKENEVEYKTSAESKNILLRTMLDFEESIFKKTSDTNSTEDRQSPVELDCTMGYGI